jgi:branched-chain amino acid transport system substrate-binding protein
MKKKIFIICLIGGLICLSFFAIMEKTVTAAAKGPIKIGVVTMKSSFLAYHGKYAEWGYKMAAEEINAKGGVLGRPIKFFWRDSKAKPDVAIREASALVFRDKVDFLMGCFLTSGTNAVSSFAKENKVLYLGSGSGVSLREEQGHRYFFGISASTTMIAKAQALNIRRKGYKTVWFIGPDYAYGHQGVKDSKRYLTELIPGVRFLGASWSPLGEKDFGPYIAEITRSKPDVVFSWLFGGDQGAFVKQANSFGLFKTIQYAGDLGPESLRPLGKEVPEGLLGISFYEFLVPDTPENKKFAENFRAKYGDYPSREAMHYYNAVHFLALAIEKAGTTETEAVIDALEKVHFNSPMGDLYFRKIDHQISLPMIAGETMKVSGLDYLVVAKDADFFPAEELWHSEAEVKAKR